MILGFDPGRDKCGVAIAYPDGTPQWYQVINRADVPQVLTQLQQDYAITQIVMGNQTTAQQWASEIKPLFPADTPLAFVNERNSSLEARDRYWQMFPPQGLARLIPQGMRLPPRPVDDIVAILLIERYLNP